MTTKPRTPDFDVSVLCKDSEIKGRIGAAWQNADGSINIQLNPFVQLPRQEGQLLITLFKRDSKPFAYKIPKFTGPPEPEAKDDADYMDTMKANRELE